LGDLACEGSLELFGGGDELGNTADLGIFLGGDDDPLAGAASNEVEA